MSRQPVAAQRARIATLDEISRSRPLTAAESRELCDLHYAEERRALYRLHRGRRKAA